MATTSTTPVPEATAETPSNSAGTTTNWKGLAKFAVANPPKTDPNVHVKPEAYLAETGAVINEPCLILEIPISALEAARPREWTDKKTGETKRGNVAGVIIDNPEFMVPGAGENGDDAVMVLDLTSMGRAPFAKIRPA